MPHLFLIGTLLVAAPAFAKDRPTVAVVGLHQGTLDAASQEAAVAQIVEAIDKTNDLDGLQQDEVAFAIQGREELILKDAFLGPGLRLLDDGRVLHDQAQFEEAAALLDEAVSALRLGMATASAPKELWDAYMYLGTTRLAVGDVAGATKAFEGAVAVNPERVPNPAKYPPDVVELHGTVAAARKEAMATITIEADQADVTVFINGAEAGSAPVTSQLAPGENHVIARGADGSIAYQDLEVEPYVTKTLQMSMAQPTLGTAADSKFARSRQVGGVYAALGEQSEVDLVLLAGVTDGLLMVQLYSPRSDAFSRPLELPYEGEVTDEVIAALPDLLQVVTEEGTIATIATSPTAAPLDVGSNQLLAQMLLNPKEELLLPAKTGLRWWHVAAGGVGAAAIAATGAYLVVRRVEEIPPNQGEIVVVVP